MSAAALITGAMTLVLGQLLNPGGSGESPIAVLEVATESSGRWMAMSVLFFFSAVMFILGLPSVLSLFTDRARGLGLFAVAVFTLGSVGVAAVSAVMVMLRSMALTGAVRPDKVVAMFDDTGLNVMLNVWVIGFQGGVLLIALALFRAQRTPMWVPLLLLGFVAVQLVAPAAGRVVAAIGLLLLAAGFTGIAVSAATPQQRRDQSTSWG